MDDLATRNAIQIAIKTGQPSQETLSERPELAKSMQLKISANLGEKPLQRGHTVQALRLSKDGYVRQRSQVPKETIGYLNSQTTIEEII